MTERLVADASVVAKFYLKDEDHADTAQRLLDDFEVGAVDLVGPEFLTYEVASALLGAVRRRRLEAEVARRALNHFLTLGMQLVGADPQSMVQEAYGLADGMSCGLYDALYLNVAVILGLPLVTADERFYRGVSPRTSALVWIGDYQSPAPPSP